MIVTAVPMNRLLLNRRRTIRREAPARAG